MKRKAQATSEVRKKIKTRHNAVDDLPWKLVTRPAVAGIGFDDGILEFEEVEGVEVVYEETGNGRVARFNVIRDEDNEKGVKDKKSETGGDGGDIEEDELSLEEDDDLDPQSAPNSDEDDPPDEDDSQDFNMNWKPFGLHHHLLDAIRKAGFNSPTPIQKEAIPVALRNRDVVGVAQTGSGKTLAYGLPILHHMLSHPWTTKQGDTRRPVRALILAPTRELAMQVSTHLNTCLNTVNASRDTESSKPIAPKKPPMVSVAAIVGGMSSQKQKRILDRGIDVLVATPGRLWDIMEENDHLSKDIKNLKFLVLDEADRMIETGHFAEMDNILRLTLRESSDDLIEGDASDNDESPIVSRDDLQTFVFSATLSKDLQRNVKKHSRPKTAGKRKKQSAPASTLDDLLLKLDFRDSDPEIIDLSPLGGVVSTLLESKIECLATDKDLYLYYFLLRYPGRSLVFLSSIDGIRRLMPLMELLNVKAFPLHSQLEQRQRLKNLDRFTTTPNSVLLATDIAARGLDIPAVDHVIHCQIPRSADVYIHRNGRTARAMQSGFSMLMCAPDERRVVRALLGGLGRKDTDIQEMPIDLGILDKLKSRVELARKIELANHKVKKANHDTKWMKDTAEALGVDLGSEYESDSMSTNPSKRQKKANDAKAANWKAELKGKLAQPLLAKGVLAKYITSGVNPIVQDLLSGEYNETMLGVKTTTAGADMGSLKKKKGKVAAGKNKKKAVEVEEEEEEWGGIQS